MWTVRGGKLHRARKAGLGSWHMVGSTPAMSALSDRVVRTGLTEKVTLKVPYINLAEGTSAKALR